MTKAAGSSRRVVRMARRMIPACKRWARRCEKLGSLFPHLQNRSNNSNGVGTLGQGADGSYNQSQMQDLINKVDELINALRR
jgi:hypothetical protein